MNGKSAISVFLMVGLFLFPGACVDVPSMKQGTPSPPNHCAEDRCSVATYPETGRELDLIFLIDTSLSMADEQAILQANFPGLVRVLQDISGGLPNLHLGTITPDLGTSPYNLPGCERPGGDRGRFLKGPANSCANPVGQTYVVDVEPRGCTISKDIVVGRTTTCPVHDCAQANCDVAAFTGLDGVATEPAGLQFAVDEHGCPRCRNYSGQSLEQVFSCMASLGTSGCGLEQQLEAVRLAVTDHSGDNTGFLRSSACLAVFIVSDEDDCSARQVELFNPAGDINSTLGTLTSFRCTEFGVVCDEPWQRVMSEGSLIYSNCRPREANDPKNMLYPISVYTNALSQLKDANMILVGAIAGPYEGSLTVGLDDNENPQLQPTCGPLSDGAMPAVRLLAFVESLLQREEDRYWAFTPICAEDFSRALYGLGIRIRSKLEVQCLAAPLCGCPDPAFALGADRLTDLPDAEAAVCAPQCTVQDRRADGAVYDLPPCPTDYAGGHPLLRDPALPVPACFHVTYNAQCAVPCPEGSLGLGCDPVDRPWHGPSRGAELVISRREDPAPYTREIVSCASLPLTEQSCSNGVDDDVDGRIDAADPDCR